MRVEIHKDRLSSVGGASVALSEIRVSSFANREGNREIRRSAILYVDSEAVEVEEGSLLSIGNRNWLVVRICSKGGRLLVRLRGAEDGYGRFAAAIERFQNQGTPFDTSMMFLIAGVNAVHDVVSRIDEHPDTVGTVADPLKRAQKYLQRARSGLTDAGASAALVAYADRYLEVCAPLLETVESSTQERQIKN